MSGSSISNRCSRCHQHGHNVRTCGQGGRSVVLSLRADELVEIVCALEPRPQSDARQRALAKLRKARIKAHAARLGLDAASKEPS